MDNFGRDALARDLFSHFTPSPGWDSLSYPMQERWRELAEYVAGKGFDECEQCKDLERECNHLEEELQAAQDRVEDLLQEKDNLRDKGLIP